MPRGKLNDTVAEQVQEALEAMGAKVDRYKRWLDVDHLQWSGSLAVCLSDGYMVGMQAVRWMRARAEGRKVLRLVPSADGRMLAIRHPLHPETWSWVVWGGELKYDRGVGLLHALQSSSSSSGWEKLTE